MQWWSSGVRATIGAAWQKAFVEQRGLPEDETGVVQVEWRCGTCKGVFGEEIRKSWRGKCTTCHVVQCEDCMILCNNCARAVCLGCHNCEHWAKGKCLPALRSADDVSQDSSLLKNVDWPTSAVTYDEKVSKTISELKEFANRLDIDNYNNREVAIRVSVLMKVRAIIAQVGAHFDVPGRCLDPNFVIWTEEGDWTAVCFHCQVRRSSEGWGSKAKNSLKRRTKALQAQKENRSDIWFCKTCQNVPNDGTAALAEARMI